MSSVDEILKEVKTIKVDVEKSVKEQVATATETIEKSTGDKFAELQAKMDVLESKVASVNVVKNVGAKSALQEAHRELVSQMKERKPVINLLSGKDIWRDLTTERDNMRLSEAARFAEASGLTGSGIGIGAQITYAPQFRTMRQMNVLRDLARVVPLSDPQMQFRIKTGAAGVTWGYTVDQTNAAGTNNAAAWTVNTSDLNVRFDVRTAALNDIDGLDNNIILDLMAEVSQVEGGAMQQNDPTQAAGTAGTYQYGVNAVKGLDSYASGTLAAGALLPALVSNTGNHTLATVCQKTLATATAVNVTYDDLINCILNIPEQYLSMPGFTFVVNRQYLAAIRSLKDTNGAPIFDRQNTITADGVIGEMLGYPVRISEYMDSPYAITPASTRYPLYFGQFGQQFYIGDQFPGTLQRFTETVPGSITYYFEKRVLAQIQDPIPFCRIASAF